MFYFLSKILYFLIMPLTLIMIGLGFAIFAKKPQTQKRSVLVSLMLIFVFGNGFLVNEALMLWEVPAIAPNEILQPYDVGIVLTGGMTSNIQSSDSQIFTDKQADRFIQPLRLYKMGKLKTILISGGNTDHIIMRKDVSNETLKVAQFLEEMGVKKEDILVETKAQNTRENALFSAEILKKNPQLGEKYMLFTSAYHQKRSVGCFQKAGITVTPFGTAYKSKARSFTLEALFIPHEFNMVEAYYLIHEILGFVVYKIMGYC
jgi:uncharacterized SAM-binding protein YcdF (DUF218 family)